MSKRYIRFKKSDEDAIAHESRRALMKITAIFDAEPVKEREVREIEKWRRATMFRSGGLAINEWL
jgi:hypothetical protein